MTSNTPDAELTDNSSARRRRLIEGIEAVRSRFSGELSVSATHLTTNERIQVNASTPFPVSSVIKLAVLIALLRQVERGALSLDSRVEMRDVDRVPGSGILKALHGGLRLTIEDLAVLMVALSDNTAANLIIDQVGGVAVVNEAMAALELDSIRLYTRIDFEIIAVDIALLGEASTDDLDRLCTLIATGRAFSSTVSGAAERILATQQHLDQAMRYVRLSPYAEELRIVQEVVTATKTGFSPGVRADTGIVRFLRSGFTYAVATRYGNEVGFGPEDEGEVANGLVGRLLTEYWWPADAGAAPVLDTPYLSGGAAGRRDGQ